MNTQPYGYNSVKNKPASVWNLIVNKIKTDMINESTIKVKKIMKTLFITHIKISKLHGNIFDL